jgi:hypothetical protein
MLFQKRVVCIQYNIFLFITITVSLFVLKGIIRSVVIGSALTWFIRYSIIELNNS